MLFAYGDGWIRHGLLDSGTSRTTVTGVQDHPENDFRDEEDEPENDPADADKGELSFIGALGVDPEQPDPGCTHDWRNLHFLEEDEGIACLRCGRAWSVDEDDSRDAVLTLWNSTKRAVEDLSLQQDRLTRIIEELTGSVRCHWCHHWSDDGDEFVTIGRRRACPEHLGQLVAEVAPAADDDLDALRLWLQDVLETRQGDIHAAWLAEKAAVECPELADETNAPHLRADDIGARATHVPAPWAGVLGIPQDTDVNAVSAVVAGILDLPRPASRPGRAFLLGVLARALRAWELGAPLDAETLTATLMEAAPSGNRDRATIVLDLYRDEMQVDGVVTGEMADDLVEALIGRAASEFADRAPRGGTSGETGHSAHDPR